MIPQLAKKSPHLTEPAISLHYSQHSATCPILSHINSVNVSSAYFFTIHLRRQLVSPLVPSHFPTQTLYIYIYIYIILFPIRAKPPALLILLDFIPRIIFFEYKSWILSLKIFPHFPLTSSVTCSQVTSTHILHVIRQTKINFHLKNVCRMNVLIQLLRLSNNLEYPLPTCFSY